MSEFTVANMAAKAVLCQLLPFLAKQVGGAEVVARILEEGMSLEPGEGMDVFRRGSSDACTDPDEEECLLGNAGPWLVEALKPVVIVGEFTRCHQATWEVVRAHLIAGVDFRMIGGKYLRSNMEGQQVLDILKGQ